MGAETRRDEVGLFTNTTKETRMAKQLALSTQLKNALMEVEALTKKVAEIESHRELYRKKSADAEAVIEQMHQMLDAVPNSVARKGDAEESWRAVERSPVTRLAAWLAGDRRDGGIK